MRETYAATLDDERCRRVPRRLRPRRAEALRGLGGVSWRATVVAASIEDYGLIGDLQTAALVSRDGSIDWLCVPRFDSGAVFAALLGDPENGHWTIQPAGEFRSVGRRYRGDTLVLETELETDDGVVRLDRLHAAARDEPGPRPDRRGRARSRRDAHGARDPLRLRLDRAVGAQRSTGTLVAIAGPDAVLLRTPVEHEGRNLRTVASFSVAAGRARAVRPALVPLQPAAARTDRRRGRARGDGRVLGGVGRRVHVRGHVARRRSPLAAHAEGADLTRRPAASSLRRRRRCPNGSAASGTGTTATAGSATRRSRCSRSCARATSTRPAPGATGCCARSPARRTTSRSCTASPASGGSPSSSCPWLAGYEGSRPVRIGNAASRPAPARRVRRGRGRALPRPRGRASPPRTTPGD